MRETVNRIRRFACLLTILLVQAPPVTGQVIKSSTFFGGTDTENALGMTVDAQGNIYIVGYTSSADLPMLPNSWNPVFGGIQDVYVARFNADLSELQAITYLGGEDMDHGYCVAIDSEGNVLVSGFTESDDLLPTAGAYDGTGEDVDGFVARFDADLTTLLAMTRIGGSGADFAYSVATDDAGLVYLAGEAISEDYPVTTGAFAETHATGYPAHTDFFISCFSEDLSSLVASTYLGGRKDEIFADIDFSSTGEIILLGSTASSNFPVTAGAYDRYFNGSFDCVVAKLSSDLTELSAASFIGHTDYDRPSALIESPTGDIYFNGYTHSRYFPTTLQAHDRTFDGPSEIIVCRMDMDLTELKASTMLGGDGLEYSEGLALSDDGTVFVSAGTDRTGFPITDGAYDGDYNGGWDIVIGRLDGSLENLLRSTYFGGDGDDWGKLCSNPLGGIMVFGSTSSENFPITENAYCTDYNMEGDAFVTYLRSLTTTAVPLGGEDDIPSGSRIESIAPNPMKPRTEIRFRIEEAGWFDLIVFDLTGRMVTSLKRGHFGMGTYSATWDGRDKQGCLQASGIYLVSLQERGTRRVRGMTRKVQLIR
ncbi:MAG: hypothetical protein GY835_27145 [bacterium]|nr:hypothetical protein [bacterium]